MVFDFNGTPVEVDIPEGFTPVDAIIVVRAQNWEDPSIDSLSMGVTDHTGGVIQAGMLSLVTSAEYAYDDDE